MKTSKSILVVFVMALFVATNLNGQRKKSGVDSYPTTFHTAKIAGLDIFYREAGPQEAPTLVLLHGYPTSSHMFRNLMQDLSQDYHLIAPDYPGYGRSSQPPMAEFEYSFDNFAEIVDTLLVQLQINSYSLYLMDYGAPVGYRIFEKHPERVEAFIVQNGNAYTEGLADFWDPLRKLWADNSEANKKPLEGFHAMAGLQWQYLHGVQDSTKVSPDNWHHDLQHLTRPENNEIQLAMFYDYRTNVDRYPGWQKLFREYQVPTLIVWGKNDYIFPPSGAYPYKRDLNNVEFHLLNTGHFALEEKGDEIANYISKFLTKNKIK
ncbi:alpha/beta hydrolase [Muricauda sp. 2012CJ35-5]|uniref:Alpha/beta hydrolase n=1 Tax=Flagellimonas spongiicola TaxID=2942208 RepID=A0ABT0PQK2_9FLAO|nr:alpha/beta hydrolase [Allomuricauda spongiicola]MCL6273660.1 alpha/beta hydrolase [Allomuricauda spongiicola]